MLKLGFVGIGYNTSTNITIRATHFDSLLEGLRLLTLIQDGHDDLRSSSYRSIIFYVHRDDCCIVVCVLQASIELG
jgi:hypothetical protein